jgi:DUF971 family protein
MKGMAGGTPGVGGPQDADVRFTDGRAYGIEAELLRVRSPSAEVQGHSPEQRVTVAARRM